MRTVALVLASLALGIFVGAPHAAAKGNGDASIGVCTRKDEFEQRQLALDKKVLELAAAKDERKRKRLAAALGKSAKKDIEGLIRYREPHLVPVFVEILQKSKKWFTRTRALYALKMLGEPDAIPAVVAVLDDDDLMVREAAAVTLGQLGGDDATAALTERLEREEDPYVRASIEASLALATAGTKPWEDREDGLEWKETLVGPAGARRVEWTWVRKGQRLFNDYQARAIEYPDATRFVYPIARYEEDLFAGYPRKSFGAGGNHAGEDCAWFRDGCSYYAIADGVVRMVQGAGGDWGFLVSIEHRLPDGRYLMSVYGHSGFDVLVKPGDVVRAGQRIGTQGLSCSVENGGYGAHLHFGLGDGPFRRPKGLAVGDTVEVAPPGADGGADGGAKKVKATVLRFGYAEGKTNSFGWPLTAMDVRLPDGSEATIEVPEQPAADELSWFQAYVKGCRGWLDPQKLLPDLVSGPTKR